MNKYLDMFFEDELTNNSYYKEIRNFADEKKLDFKEDVVSVIIDEYYNVIDNFGPYRFMDAIEDFIEEQKRMVELGDEENILFKLKDMCDVLDYMWEDDLFNDYSC